jgi:hypothetical protein
VAILLLAMATLLPVQLYLLLLNRQDYCVEQQCLFVIPLNIAMEKIQLVLQISGLLVLAVMIIMRVPPQVHVKVVAALLYVLVWMVSFYLDFPQFLDLCVGICGDGIKASSEQW